MTSVADRPTGTQTADLTAEQAAQLIGELRAVHASGRTQPLEWRLRQLKGIVRLFEENEPAMAAALASDLGRNAHDTWFGDVASTVGEARYAIKHLKKWMRPKRVGVPLAVMPGKARIQYEPLGVVLVIGPWNYPFYLCFGPMVGALAAGNCVVLKPSEHAPAASALMAQLIPKYLDKDAVRVVEGEAAATQQLIDARVDHVFFTGGTEIGRKVMQAAAKHLTPVTLELGGKSPVIVTKDADLEVAARRILWGKLINSGQTCLAPDYVLVENSVKNDLVGQLKTQLVALREGEAKEQQIVNDRQFDRLASYLDEQPGQVVAGGSKADTKIETTLVVDADPASQVMSGEIFGPILPILGVKDLSEAITFVNRREKPLASYLFSKNKAEQQRVLNEISCGGTVINHTLMHVLVPQLPFGGVGESGMGAYHGKWGFECFSHRKSTLVMPTRPDLKMIYPPYSERDKKLLRKLA
ncbi:MAG: aldehyde dehydrogenase family protein [Nocardioides sp.]